MAYPNLIIGGAPKCGTSSVYFWLSAHPDACSSRQKETFFFADSVNRFNKDLNIHDHSLEAYQQHFQHCEGQKVIFEATAPYIYMEQALKHIPQLPTQPKVVFFLREPAARTLSQYLFQRDRLGITNCSFEEYVKRERVLKQGNYASYLKLWKAALPDNRLKVILFEEFLADKVQGMKDLCDFCGLDGSFYEDFNFTQRNETVKMKSKKLHQFGLKLQQFVPHSVQEKLLPLYLKLNSGGKSKGTPQEKGQLKDLKLKFEKPNQELEELFPHLDFEKWKK